MTHDELLNRINEDERVAHLYGYSGHQGLLKYFNSLRAVVELHKPEPLDERGDVCLTCCPDLLTLYPCSTIQAIEKELK